MDVHSALSPRIPPELVLNVFDHSPKATLIACSNVSRQWRTMSAPYRFRDTVVRCPHDGEVPVEAEATEDGEGRERVEEGVKKTLSSFLLFLQQFPHIANEIHQLTIDLDPTKDSAPLYDADHQTFVGILCSLPRLRSLILEDVFLPNWQSQVLTEVQLDTLTIRYPSLYDTPTEFVEGDELLGMLKLFGDVQDISLEQFAFNPLQMFPPFPLQNGLRSLRLRKVWNIAPLFEALKTSQSTDSNLCSLVIQDLAKYDINDMNVFLAATGHRFLNLGCCIPLEVESEPHALDLSRCTRLRSLTLYVQMSCLPFISSIPHPNEKAWEFLLHSLRRLPFEDSPLVLDQLILSLGVHNVTQNTAREDLESILPQVVAVEDTLFEWVEKGLLRGVRVELARSLADGVVLGAGFMSELFPRLHGAGVLSLGK